MSHPEKKLTLFGTEIIRNVTIQVVTPTAVKRMPVLSRKNVKNAILLYYCPQQSVAKSF